MKLTLCIPLYNEEKILRDTMATVRTFMDGHFGEDYEVIWINDGSVDSCPEILSELCDERFRFLSYSPNRGKGYAVRQGMLDARGDLVIFTDCDLAYGLDVIPEMVALFDENPGWDAVVGSRAKHPEGYAGYSFFRRVVSKTYLKILRVWGGLKLSDSQTGLKGFRNETAKKIFSRCEIDRFAFDFEAILIGQKFGVKFGEMPVKIINHRESTVHFFRDSFRMMRDIAKMKKRIRKLS